MLVIFFFNWFVLAPHICVFFLSSSNRFSNLIQTRQIQFIHLIRTERISLQFIFSFIFPDSGHSIELKNGTNKREKIDSV